MIQLLKNKKTKTSKRTNSSPCTAAAVYVFLLLPNETLGTRSRAILRFFISAAATLHSLHSISGQNTSVAQSTPTHCFPASGASIPDGMTLVSLRVFLPCPSKRNETRAPDTVSIFGDLGRSGGPWWLVQWVGTSTSKSLLSSHRPPSSVLGGGTFIIIFTWVPSGRNEGTNGLHMGSRHLKKNFKL